MVQRQEPSEEHSEASLHLEELRLQIVLPRSKSEIKSQVGNRDLKIVVSSKSIIKQCFLL
jgi:hypothetical protein